MYYIKELCVKLITYQKLYRDARSAKYKKQDCLAQSIKLLFVKKKKTLLVFSRGDIRQWSLRMTAWPNQQLREATLFTT